MKPNSLRPLYIIPKLAQSSSRTLAKNHEPKSRRCVGPSGEPALRPGAGLLLGAASLLVDPGVRPIGDLDQEWLVLAAETGRVLPLLAVLVEPEVTRGRWHAAAAVTRGPLCGRNGVKPAR